MDLHMMRSCFESMVLCELRLDWLGRWSGVLDVSPYQKSAHKAILTLMQNPKRTDLRRWSLIDQHFGVEHKPDMSFLRCTSICVRGLSMTNDRR